jgi:ethanolamine utilization protein EutA
MGPVLGQAIRSSRLCRNAYRLGAETIRATVIGAGCHSAQLSGSTVFYQNVSFPMKNLPVICLTEQEQEDDLTEIILRRRGEQDGESLIHLPGRRAPEYGWVKDLAKRLVAGLSGQPVYVAVENDMAKALGQAMAALLPQGASCLCIDSVKLTPNSYLDVGAPVGPALPVVVKTLVLNTK